MLYDILGHRIGNFPVFDQKFQGFVFKSFADILEQDTVLILRFFFIGQNYKRLA